MSACKRNWRLRSVPPGARRLRFHGASGRVHRNPRDASQGKRTAHTTGDRSRIMWTNRSPCQFPRSAPHAAERSRWRGSNHSIRKKSGGALGYGGLISRSAAVRVGPASPGASSAANLRCHRSRGGASGPEALTLGVLMNKAQGLPHADAAAILQQGFHLQMSRSGICRAIQRVACKAEATWQALRDAARRSQLASMDETGWKVEAQLRWLWAVVTEQITYCQILPGRGFAEAASILGAEYAGWLIHDGWQIYYKFLKELRQCSVQVDVQAKGLGQSPW